MQKAGGSSDCGAPNFTIDLNGVSCEVAEAMVVLLNGDSNRQTLTLVDGQGNRVAWQCVSRSIEGPLRCGDGRRSFLLRLDRHGD